ncbi:MAG: hypothetical protein AMXMBFR75_33420 [Candidatus Hinthialibacteria bacterium]
METEDSMNVWIERVSEHMPHLSKPQAVVLAMWSFGMVMCHSCGLTSVAAFLADMLGQREGSVRQRLREWYKDASDKKGKKREDVDETTCFVPLIGWVLSWWSSDEKRLAVAMDASSLGERFVVLAISIVYRGCAIPVAWVVVAAASKGSWRTHWEALFTKLKGSIPEDWMVIVMADRGLYAPWLFTSIQGNGWHPFLRINKAGTFQRRGESQFLPLSLRVPSDGSVWAGVGICFKSNPLACTLLACWDEAHKDPWLIVTDLLPSQADIFWYSMRAWIECGFKQTKRAGWQWQNTKITDPQRASRLWLAIAIATLWVVSVGGEAEDALPASTFDALPLTHIARRRTTKRSRPRLLSCFRRGLTFILASLIAGRPLPLGRFVPQPWPSQALSSP